MTSYFPGTTKLGHLEENLKAADLELTAADVKEIEVGFANISLQGTRSSKAVLGLVDIGARAGTTSAGGHGLSPLRSVR